MLALEQQNPRLRMNCRGYTSGLASHLCRVNQFLILSSLPLPLRSLRLCGFLFNPSKLGCQTTSSLLHKF